MPDYLKSKIYKLTSSNTNDIYIGSTVNNLAKRKAQHISNYKRYLINGGNYMTSCKIIEFGGDIDICLLEEYPCNNTEQLHQRERFYIENYNCVNKLVPTRSIQEYYEVNKDKYKEYNREYYKLNKDKYKEYIKSNQEKYNEYQKQCRLKKRIEKEQQTKTTCG
jgi:hypothetical protein